MAEPTRYTRKAVTIDCSQDGRTKQSQQDMCDINRIMASYRPDQPLTHINQQMPHYGDFSDVQTYQEALNNVNQAEELFMELPASIRTKFENDPGQYLDFVADDSNMAEAIELGLVEDPNAKRTVSEPPQVEPDPQGKSGETPSD